MKAFTYERPASAAEAAAAAVRTPGAKFIAGGTNLLDLMKLQIETPTHLVDVNRLGLDRLSQPTEGGLRIGALVRNTDLAADPRMRAGITACCPGRLSPAPRVSSATRRQLPAICCSGRGAPISTTPICHATSARLVRAAPRSVASTHNHAIIGASEACIATHPSDMAVAMRALDASGETVAPGGASRSDSDRRFASPPREDAACRNHAVAGRTDHGSDAAKTARRRAALRKVRERASYAFATVSVALIAKVEGGRVTVDRLAFGGLAHKPWRVEQAEHVIAREDDAAADPIADIVLAGAKPTEQNALQAARSSDGRSRRLLNTHAKEHPDDRRRHQPHRRPAESHRTRRVFI